MLVFRQLFDPPSSTYTYLLADGKSGAAVIIDPVFEQVRRDAALIDEFGLKLLYSLETHVHADHVTGGWLLRQQTGCNIALSADSGAEGADRYLVPDDVIAFGSRNLQVRKTPGHTNGCLTYVLDDRSMAFTGDCLMIRGSGRTDFQQGDPDVMYRSVHQQIFALPETCLLYPAHDYRGLTVTSVREERHYNPRLGGETGEADFTGYMKNLRLAHPKKLDVAVPANLKCGKPEGEVDMKAAPTGRRCAIVLPDLGDPPPRARRACARGAARRCSRAGGILRATRPYPRRGLIPLGTLAERARELAKDRPIVAVCRSGSRSAQATVILREAGFSDAANLAGGMLRWRSEGHTVEGGSAMDPIPEYSI